MADLEKIGRELEIAKYIGANAQRAYSEWMAGKVGKIILVESQRATLRTDFVSDITAVRDAAQAVLDELA